MEQFVFFYLPLIALLVYNVAVYVFLARVVVRIDLLLLQAPPLTCQFTHLLRGRC